MSQLLQIIIIGYNIGMKTIVTHLSPDLDAVTAVWLVKTYFPGWEEAEIAFVPVESTLNNLPPDDDKNIIHVDTGGGKYDHHGTSKKTSASRLVFEQLLEYDCVKKKDRLAIERIVEYVTFIDNFQEVELPEADADIYDFCPHQLIFSIRSLIPDDHKLTEFFTHILVAMLSAMKTKISAEEDIAAGMVFESKWGKTIAMESKNEEAVKLALKKNFMVALRKDPQRGFLKIKINPFIKENMSALFEILIKRDPNAHWSLQGNGHIIINGSSRKPNSVATKLTLNDVIEIIKGIK